MTSLSSHVKHQSNRESFQSQVVFYRYNHIFIPLLLSHDIILINPDTFKQSLFLLGTLLQGRPNYWTTCFPNRAFNLSHQPRIETKRQNTLLIWSKEHLMSIQTQSWKQSAWYNQPGPNMLLVYEFYYNHYRYWSI